MNLMNEDLVWMTEKDYIKILTVCNIASNLVFLNEREVRRELYDLDGEEVSDELFKSWQDAVTESHDALGRAKYVPEDVLPKLRLILMSD